MNVSKNILIGGFIQSRGRGRGRARGRARTISRPSFSPPIHKPAKMVNRSYIAQIFSIAQELDVERIKNFMTTNNISYNIVNENGESLLHVVLRDQNANITQNRRLALVEFLVKQGARINAYDKDNNTPLHFTTKYQWEKISKFLIENGADLSATNNVGRTPLHYISEGGKQVCDKSSNVGSLIPKDIKIKDNKSKQKLAIEIIKILKTDPFQYYIKNIYKNLQQVDEIYDKEYMGMYDELTDKIIITLADENKSELEKKAIIDEEIATNIDNMNRMVEKRLKQTISKLDIRPNQEDGWGPNNTYNPKEMILPGPIPEDKIKMIQNENMYTDTLEIINNALKELQNNVDKLVKYKREINGDIAMAVIMNKYIEDYVQEKEPTQVSIKTLSNMKNLIKDERTLSILNVDSNTITEHKTMIRSSFIELFINQIPQIYYLNREMIKLNKKNNISMTKYNLIDSNIITSYPSLPQFPLYNNNNLDPYQAIQYWTVAEGQIKEYFPQNNNIIRIYLTKLFVGIKHITDNLNRLKKMMRELRLHLSQSYYYEIVTKIIPIAVIYILNMNQYLASIYEEHQQIQNVNGDLLKKASILEDNFGGTNYLYEKIVDAFKNIDNNNNNIKQLCSELYKNNLGVYNSFNNLIDHINNQSGLNMMILLHNNNFTNDKIKDNSINMFENTIPPLVKIPQTLQEYRLKYPHHSKKKKINIVKGDLYKEIIPKIDAFNFNKYLTKSNHLPDNFKILYHHNDKKIYGTIKWLVDNKGQTKNDLIKKYMKLPMEKSNIDKSKSGYLSPLTISNPTIYETQNIKPPQLKPNFDIKQEIFKLEDPDNVTKNENNIPIGQMALTLNYNIQDGKSTFIKPSIKNQLDNLLYITKYKIIQEIFDKIDTIGDLKNKYNDLNSSLESNFKIEDETQRNSVTNSIFAKTVEEILINYIRTSIHKGNVNSVIEILKTRNPGVEVDITKLDIGFKTNFSKLFNDINSIILQNVDIEPIPTMKDAKIQNQIFIYDANYGATDKLEKMCYKINPELIDLFDNYLHLINLQDSTGSTPLHLAVDTLYHPLIQKLIDKNASIHSVKNNMGFTALDKLINIYENHNNLMYDEKYTKIVKDFHRPLSKTVITYFKSKPEYKNNIIRYFDNIFPQLILMFNHMLYIDSKNYLRLWTFEDQTKLEKILSDRYNINIKYDYSKNLSVPMLQTVKDEKITKDTVKVINKKLQKDIKNSEQKLEIVTKRIESLKLEKQNANDEEYKKFIDAEMNELNNQKNTLENEITTLKDGYENKIKDKIDSYPNLKNSINTFSNAQKRFNRNISKLYQDAKIEIVDKEDKPNNLYNKLWELYINSDESLKNITNIHIALVQLQHDIIKTSKYNLNSKEKLKEILGDLKILDKYYKNILTAFVNDTVYLSQELNSNPFLKRIFEIIEHVVKNIICVSFYHVIMRSVAQYISSIKATSVTKMEDVETYIYDELPNKITKHLLNIFDDDDDGAKDILSIDDLFAPITNEILQNDKFPVKKESTMIKNLEDYIYPYYADLFKQTIPKMKTLFDNYGRYIMNDHKFIQILIAFLENHTK